MSNLIFSNLQLENKFIFSTPKFNQTLNGKESHDKNPPLGLDLPSFEEPKYSTEKKNFHIKFNKDYIDENKNLDPLKDNFSICSLVTEKINDEKETNINDINNNENDNNKIKLININIAKPNSKRKKERALISFGDKSENENTSLNNNEIIYREKTINSSIMSNKEKEKENGNIKESTNNDNIDNSLSKKESSNLQNNNSSFQYSLPLENDLEPNFNDFFILDENNDNNKMNDNNEKNDKKEGNSKNNLINRENIKKEENDKNNLKDLDKNKNKLTYSKKKPNRSMTERQSLISKIIQKGDILNKIHESNNMNNGYNDKNIKINNKTNLLNSCENPKKFNKKIKLSSIDISIEENKEEKDKNLYLLGKLDSYLNPNCPQKKLSIIKKLKLYNLPKVDDDNLQIKNYSSRENLQKIKIKYGKNTLDKNILNEIDLNSLTSNPKKFKNLKFAKFPGLFSDFQKFKKISPKFNEEMTNYNNIINSNISNNANSHNHTVIGSNINSKNFIIKKNNENKLLNLNKKINMKDYLFQNNEKTRNFDSAIFYNSNKKINKELFNTINYENIEGKSKEIMNKNINKKKENINKNALNNKIKQKVVIKSSIPKSENSIKKIYKVNNKNNQKLNVKYIKNNNIDIKNNIKNKNQFKQNINKSDINPNKPNFNYNNSTQAKINQNQKNIYNKFEHDGCKTNQLYNTKKIKQNQNIIENLDKEKTINKNKIPLTKNFINDNFSSNSLQNNNYNRIRVHMLLNKHNKIVTSPNLSSQSNIKDIWKIYKKPKNTCLINQINNDYNTISGNRSIRNNNINNNKKEITEYNSGNKSNRNTKIIQLRKKLINSTNLTERNSSSKFGDKSNEIKSKPISSMQDLNIYKNKILSQKGSFSRLHNYDEEIIKYSIFRNNKNNQVINEFSLTVGKINSPSSNDNLKKYFVEKNDLNKNRKKNLAKNEGTNNNKKTIINVNQYYPSYFINAQNHNFKEKK